MVDAHEFHTVLKDERVGCGSGDGSRALAALWAGMSRQAVYP